MFNRGDKVVCIDNENVEHYLTVDKIYEVCEYSEINKVINLLKMDTWYRVERFELIEKNGNNNDLINHLAKEAFKLGSKDDRVLDIIKNLI